MLRSILDLVNPESPVQIAADGGDAERERRAILREAVRRNEETFLREAGIGEVFRRRLDDCDVPQPIRAWWQAWTTAAPTGGAILAGPVGTGKTTIAARCLRAVYRSGRWDDADSPTRWIHGSARLVRFADLRRRVFAREPIQGLERVSLLVIDDVSPIPESAWFVHDELHALVDARWSDGLATIVTTNLIPDGEGDTFAARFEAIYSRLCDGTGPGAVRVVGCDYRRAPR